MYFEYYYVCFKNESPPSCFALLFSLSFMAFSLNYKREAHKQRTKLMTEFSILKISLFSVRVNTDVFALGTFNTRHVTNHDLRTLLQTYKNLHVSNVFLFHKILRYFSWYLDKQDKHDQMTSCLKTVSFWRKPPYYIELGPDQWILAKAQCQGTFQQQNYKNICSKFSSLTKLLNFWL